MTLPVKTHTQFCSQAGKQYQVNCPTCSTVERALDVLEAEVRHEFPKPTLGIQKVLRMISALRGGE